MDCGLRGPTPHFYAGQESRVLDPGTISKYVGILRGTGISAEFCPAVFTGEHVLANSAGVLVGGRRHINQMTVSLHLLGKLKQAAGRIIARHVQAVVPGGLL